MPNSSDLGHFEMNFQIFSYFFYFFFKNFFLGQVVGFWAPTPLWGPTTKIYTSGCYVALLLEGPCWVGMLALQPMGGLPPSTLAPDSKFPKFNRKIHPQPTIVRKKFGKP